MAVEFAGERTVFGNKAMAVGDIVITGISSGAVLLPIGQIDGAVLTKKYNTAAENTFSVAYNQASGGTATNGMLFIGSAAAGDSFSVMAWGQA